MQQLRPAATDLRLKIFSPIESVDGGWAWVVCGANFTFLFCLGGVVNSFGVLYAGLVDHYTTITSTNSSISPNSTSVPSGGISGSLECLLPCITTAWIQSITLYVMCLSAPIVASLIGKFGTKPVLFAGTTAEVCGLLFTSWTDSVWQMYLTYGILIGLGSSILWTTALSLLPHYFERRLLVASSVGTMGTCLGCACFPPITRTLLALYGWRRMLQLTTLVGVPLLVSSALFRPPANFHPEKISMMHRVIKCWKLQKNVRLSVYLWLTSVHWTAIYIPTVYIIQFAEQTVNVDEGKSGFLLTVMFLTAAISCVLTGMLAKRVKRKIFLLQLLFAVGGLSSLLFPFYNSYAHLMVYMIIQGVAYSHITLLPVIPLMSKMITIRENADAFALQTFTQTAGLLGVPIAGWMYDRLGSYTPGFVLSGSVAVFLSVLLFIDVYLEKKSVTDSCAGEEVGCNKWMSTTDEKKSDFLEVVYYETYV